MTDDKESIQNRQGEAQKMISLQEERDHRQRRALRFSVQTILQHSIYLILCKIVNLILAI